MDHNLFAKIYSKQYPPIHGKMRIKYPRTYHLPWSLGSTDDDKTTMREIFKWNNGEVK